MVAELKTAIEAYLERHNANAEPFAWTAPAKDILKIVALRTTSVRVGTLGAQR